MDRQTTLFDRLTDSIPVNPTVAPEDRPRLSAQCDRLLRSLIVRPRTNLEIVSELKILNSTGRISDLRAAGCTVTGTNLGKGVWLYTLDYYPETLTGRIEP